MNTKKMVLVLIYSFAIGVGIAQTETRSVVEELEARYQENILKQRINGVYIPKDINDAFVEFKHLSPGESIEKFKAASEDLVARKLHFGLGKWMIVNWSFYEGSRLSHNLRSIGILHPDDMADFLIRIFHRKLNNEPDNIEPLVEAYALKRAEERKSRKR